MVCNDSPEQWIHQFPKIQSSDNRAREVLPGGGDLKFLHSSAASTTWHCCLRMHPLLFGQASPGGLNPPEAPHTSTDPRQQPAESSKCILLVWIHQQLFSSTVSCLPVPSPCTRFRYEPCGVDQNPALFGLNGPIQLWSGNPKAFHPWTLIKAFFPGPLYLSARVLSCPAHVAPLGKTLSPPGPVSHKLLYLSSFCGLLWNLSNHLASCVLLNKC